jgi:hypothetical protein
MLGFTRRQPLNGNWMRSENAACDGIARFPLQRCFDFLSGIFVV